MRDKSICSTIAGLFIYLITSELRAQTELNELTVDRPGIAESPFTVAPGTFQFETGFDYYNRANGDIYFLPTMLFRTGISNGAELRITERQTIDKTGEGSFSGLSPLYVGVKVHIIQQKRWIPETDILTNLVIPLGSGPLQPNGLGHELLLLFQHDITEKFAINYNVGYLWFNIEQGEIFTASFCFNYLPTKRVGLFAEYFTLSTSWPGEHGMDGGLTYLLTPHVQLDLSGGISTQDSNTNFFLSTGFSVRFQRKERVDM
jgi:hypothetical protein